eukprot:scaffold18717_cov72-Skeletonema_dohrnii-CCMP3373.AAC.1
MEYSVRRESDTANNREFNCSSLWSHISMPVPVRTRTIYTVLFSTSTSIFQRDDDNDEEIALSKRGLFVYDVAPPLRGLVRSYIYPPYSR